MSDKPEVIGSAPEGVPARAKQPLWWTVKDLIRCWILRKHVYSTKPSPIEYFLGRTYAVEKCVRCGWKHRRRFRG